MFAVMDDVRHTLRMSWVDPAFRSVSAHPLFFTAAWAATRPNMTRSFAAGADRLRLTAIDLMRPAPGAPRIQPGGDSIPEGNSFQWDLGTLERERLIRTVQAVLHAAPKVALVLQAWSLLARRRRVPGTGLEEPPAKRGIPSWQEDLVAFPRSVSPEADALIDDATVELGLVAAPSALQAVAAWPHFLEDAWTRLQPLARSPRWQDAVTRVRGSGAQVLRTLPHPMDLQWEAIGRRGFTEDRRKALAEHAVALAAGMPVNVLVAAFLWWRLGGPELPGES